MGEPSHPQKPRCIQIQRLGKSDTISNIHHILIECMYCIQFKYKYE